MFKKFQLPFIGCIVFFLILYFSFRLEKSSTQLKVKKIFYVPPYSYINAISGSFKVSVADIFYIRAILSIAEEEKEYLDYILSNLRLAVELDPRLTSAYIIGGIVAPRGKEEIPQGIQFLKEGMARNQQEWRIPFWVAFNYFQLEDYLKAGQYYKIASLLPDAPRYLKGLTAWSYYKGGKSDLGVLFLEGMLDSVNDPGVLKSMERKVEWLKNIVFLEKKVAEFKNIFGRWPRDLDELVKNGLIKEIPKDPFGKGYYLDDRWYDQRYAGKVKSKF